MNEIPEDMPPEMAGFFKMLLSAKQESEHAQVGKTAIPQIAVPTGMSYKTAADHLKKKHKEEQQQVQVDRTFDVLPWAGAFAVQNVLTAGDVSKGGYFEVNTPFGTISADSEDIQVPSSRGTVSVFWGNWEIPGLGELKLWQRRKPGSYVACFGVTIECKQKRKHDAETLMNVIAEEVEKCELYKGSCVELKPDDDGDLIIGQPPNVYPMPTSTPDDLILSQGLSRQVVAELFTPITHRDRLKELDAGGSRGVLLAGRPGTGKTLSARIATRLALDNEWSAFYLPDARAIEAALAIASAHSPAILICEDLDRQLGGDRTSAIDRVLNALDGLDKSKEVIFVATTNDDSDLPAPLLRPGRLHSLINFEVPDVEAAGRLLGTFLGKRTPDNLDEAAQACEGLLPASIEEVARRSVLHSVAHGNGTVASDDLKNAAIGVQAHQRRLEVAEAKTRPERDSYDVYVHKGDMDLDRLDSEKLLAEMPSNGDGANVFPPPMRNSRQS